MLYQGRSNSAISHYHGARKTEEGGGTKKTYGTAKIIRILQHLVKLSEIPYDHLPMALQHRHRHKQDEFLGIIPRPEDFPEMDNGVEWEFTFESDEDPAKGEEEVERVGAFEVGV